MACVFMPYSHGDEELRQELEKHLRIDAPWDQAIGPRPGGAVPPLADVGGDRPEVQARSHHHEHMEQLVVAEQAGDSLGRREANTMVPST